MKKEISTVSLTLGALILAGCATAAHDADPDRAGCTYVDGKARYGSLTQYAKGKGNGAHIYVGKNVQNSKLEITCNTNKQEVKWNNK